MVDIEIEAILKEGEIIVPLSEDADILFKSGYGTLREGEGLILSLCETAYLIAEYRIQVVEGPDNTKVEFKSLIERFMIDDPDIWIRYLIYRDLRSRGYVVKEGVGWGVDFRLYERGKFHKKAAKFIVFGVYEGNPISAKKLGKILRLVHGIKKEMIVAVIDRRGQIVYYSLTRLNLKLRLKSGE